MTTMKAGLYDGKGGMHVANIEKPKLAPGDILARVRSTGICGSDLLHYSGNTTPDTLPGGHEVAGEIYEVGADVDQSMIGLRVAIENIGHGLSCGMCWFCKSGQYVQCTNKYSSEGGGYAELIKRRADGCYPIPETMSWAEAALVEPLAVAVHGIRRGHLMGGETVLVLGTGNIGLTTIAAARLMGAGKILATARHPQQTKLAKDFGADEVLDSEAIDLKDLVDVSTNGKGADLTIESVGGYSDITLKQSIDLTRTQGRIVILGGFLKPVTLDWITPLIKEQSIIFSSCYSLLDGKHDYEIAIDQLNSKRINMEQMVTHRFSLQEINEGFQTAYDKSTGSIKVQIHQ